MLASDNGAHPLLSTVARLQVFGASPAALYLRLNRRLWRRLPSGINNSAPFRRYGAWLHTMVCLSARRQQLLGTFFLRNRPALELMRRLSDQRAQGATLRIAVLGCSIGAEVYSILWTIRSVRPDLNVELRALDISEEVLSFAQEGVYAPETSQLVGASIFERLTKAEMLEMFDWEAGRGRIKRWLREGIVWQCGNAADPDLIRVLGPQDIIIASNFLCHMASVQAEKCLSNIGLLGKPGSYFFVAGVDLDVRTKVACQFGWEPVSELTAEMHDGDPSIRADWPWEWWGLEPLDMRRPDWQMRYASAFRVPGEGA